MDLLHLIQKLPSAPPIFNSETLDKFGKSIEIPPTTFPTPTFASKIQAADGRSFPQAIAHRGHKAEYLENSLRAFEAAIQAGAHAIETDVHLSRDGVVVLSHDRDLKRCFNVERRICDCDWRFLETLRTTRTPSQPMARLEDLLRLLSRDSSQSVWLMLDIKFDDEPEDLMMHIADAFRRVSPGPSSQWKDRVLLSYWTASFIPLCHKYLPGFPIANIGFSIPYSRQFLQVPGSGFNLLQASAVSPAGRNFIQDLQARGRRIFTWTVNDEKNMDFCIRWGVDGVVTDDVPKFLKICEEFKVEKQPAWPIKLLLGFVYFNFWVFVFSAIFKRWYGTCVRIPPSKASKSDSRK